jgi:hypothetical protein
MRRTIDGVGREQTRRCAREACRQIGADLRKLWRLPARECQQLSELRESEARRPIVYPVPTAVLELEWSNISRAGPRLDHAQGGCLGTFRKVLNSFMLRAVTSSSGESSETRHDQDAGNAETPRAQILHLSLASESTRGAFLKWCAIQGFASRFDVLAWQKRQTLQCGRTNFTAAA